MQADTPRPTFEEFSPITTQIEAAFASDQLVLDFPSMELRQLGDGPKRVFHGRGLLQCCRDRYFEMRMYADAVPDASAYRCEDYDRLLARQSGEIIPREDYYELIATDTAGIVWTCEKVDIKPVYAADGVVITGKLYEALRHRKVLQSSATKAWVQLYFFTSLEVEFNRFVRRTTEEGERITGSEIEEVSAEFSAGSLNFHVRKVPEERGSIVMRATSETNEMPQGVETRIEEALSYVLVGSTHWCICEKRYGSIREISMVPRAQRSECFLTGEQPVPHKGSLKTHFWPLFKAYFEHIVSYEEGSLHPLSIHLHHVISGDARDLSLVGLILSVAVEGVLNTGFDGIAKPTNQFRVTLDKIKLAIDRLRCVDGDLARRLKGSVDAMRQSRAGDKLRVLVDCGVVTSDQVKIWTTLRNKSAHAGVKLHTDEARNLLIQCYTVYAMLHRLVFQIVGYTGEYRDFSSANWPGDTFTHVPAEALKDLSNARA